VGWHILSHATLMRLPFDCAQGGLLSRSLRQGWAERPSTGPDFRASKSCIPPFAKIGERVGQPSPHRWNTPEKENIDKVGGPPAKLL
jgi:hypothetical protein